MKSLIICACILFAVNISSQTKDCQCGTTKGKDHPRQMVKDRSIPSDMNNSSNASIKDIIGWEIPDNPELKGNEKDPKENNLYSVTGYIRVIRVEPDDCDMQIELSADKQDAGSRIIAEIPNTKEYCSVREQLLKQLKDKYNFTLKGNSSTLKNSPQVKLTGFAFWDSDYYSERAAAREKGKGHGSKDVKTLWELHPIVNVEIK